MERRPAGQRAGLVTPSIHATWLPPPKIRSTLDRRDGRFGPQAEIRRGPDDPPWHDRGDRHTQQAAQDPSTSSIPPVLPCIGLLAAAPGRLHSLYNGIFGCPIGSFRSGRCGNGPIGCTG